MPIYEYICRDCGARFEILRAMKDADTLLACQKCNSEHTSRLLSMFCAQSGGRTIAGSGSGCTGCAGGSCSSCGR